MKKSLTTTPSVFEQELDKSTLLDEKGKQKFQILIVSENWLVNIRRADVLFAVNQLSRFCASSREEHLKLYLRIFEYLNKFSVKHIYTEGKTQTHFIVDLHSRRITAPRDMASYNRDSISSKQSQIRLTGIRSEYLDWC